jgi:choline dehydrogenase-like flavoprotein
VSTTFDRGAPPTHDVVIVGAGVTGALVAKRLTDAGLRVLVLEAGPDTTSSYADYLAHVQHFFGAAGKGPESAWPPAMAAPQPDTADLRSADQHTGYFVQTGPQLYGSSYTRVFGGSTVHWLGVCLRMLPEDFQMRNRYGVAVDWPIGYDELEPWYRDAERQIGVSADVADQAHLGVTFPSDYDYPMRRIPPSWSDQVLAAAVDGTSVEVGSTTCTLKIRNYPAARNSIPRGDYVPVGAVDERPQGQALGHELGQRCAGNTACTPICPIQAKYNAAKTLAQCDRSLLEVRCQAVAAAVHVDPASGEVTGIEYQRYDDPSSVRHSREVATARVYVLAAHAVENAKLLLASGLAGSSGQLGRNLMDHPCLYAWGLAQADIGAFRGPLSTAGLDDCRGGSFRAEHAAFRFDIGNDGWRAPTGAPDTTVASAVGAGGLHGRGLRAHLTDQLRRQVRLSLAVEQLPSHDNGISVDPRWVDAMGNPRPVVSYTIADYTLAGMVAARRVADVVFAKAGITDGSEFAAEVWFPSVSYQGTDFSYHGMGHFAGTHRMGSDPSTSVVDSDQRCWEHRNLYLLGSGSFPTMGTSNPTLTMAALALRTAEALMKELRT